MSGFDVSKAVSTILPMINSAGSVTGSLAAMDPMNMAVNFVCDGLGLPPETKNIVKLAAGAATGNFLLAADGAIGVVQDLSKNPPAQTEYPPQKDAGAASAGYAAPRPKSPEQLEREQYLEVLQLMDKRFDRLDGGMHIGNIDQKIDAAKIEEFACSSDPELRKIGEFFRKHPELLKELDNSGGRDGKISRTDIGAAMSLVQSRIDADNASRFPGLSPTPRPLPIAHGDSPATGGAAQAGYQSQINGILNDPSLSAEEKVMMVLALIMQMIDNQLESTVGAMGERAAKRAELEQKVRDAEKDGTDTDAITKAKAELGAFDAEGDVMQLKIQQLVQKRSQMFQLMSTMSTNFHEMAKAAIQNTGRA